MALGPAFTGLFKHEERDRLGKMQLMIKRKDPRDNWFNNGANRLWKEHPVLFSMLFLSMLGLLIFLRTLKYSS